MFNKFKFLLSTMVLMATVVFGGELVDPRDGQKYKTVQIGDQIWMAENLKYRNGAEAINEQGDVFYSWEKALSVCPGGWRLPDDDDFSYLIDETRKVCETCSGEGTLTEKNLLEMSEILRSKDGWAANENGLNKLAFNATPTGAALIGENVFQNTGFATGFWSSTKKESEAVFLVITRGVVQMGLYETSSIAFPVRCVKEDIKENKKNMRDPRDGKTYETVKIGDQTWMAENLNFVSMQSECYGNKEENCDKYGRLYYWVDAQNVCPSGWHLPNKEEFEKLQENAGGKSNAGTALKFRRKWYDNGNGKDEYGFSALPAGAHSDDGDFINMGYETYFWSASNDNGDHAYSLALSCDSEDARLLNVGKNYAFSVRCVQDTNEDREAGAFIAPSLGSMTDSRDGQKYKTVQIGDREWMAENLRFKTPGSVCWNNDEESCDLGRLYKLKPVQQWCPEGWHLPTLPEVACVASADGSCVEVYPGQESFAIAASKMVGDEKLGTAMKYPKFWKPAKNVPSGTDRIGFSVLPVGNYNGKQFQDFGGGAYFWTSTSDRGSLAVYTPEFHLLQGEKNKKGAYFWYFYNDSEEMGVNVIDSDNYLSIRCVRDH